MVQWLRLSTSNAGGMGSIPGQGTKIRHAVWHGHKEKKKKKTLKKVLLEKLGSYDQVIINSMNMF